MVVSTRRRDYSIVGRLRALGECVICRLSLGRGQLLARGRNCEHHWFCALCLIRWGVVGNPLKPRCPLDRKRMDVVVVHRDPCGPLTHLIALTRSGHVECARWRRENGGRYSRVGLPRDRSQIRWDRAMEGSLFGGSQNRPPPPPPPPSPTHLPQTMRV